MTSFNILITSAGRRCQLIDCFRDDAKALGLEANLFAADLNPEMSPACQIADKSFQVSPCASPGYIDELLAICKNNAIQLLVPTIDTELQPLADSKDRFTKIGVAIGISSPAAVYLSQDKAATSEALANLGIPTPRSCSWDTFEADDTSWKYPLIFKPNSGSNSQGLLWAQTPSEIPELKKNSHYLVQECLEGTEYTINTYFNADGVLLASVPHQRIEVRGGEVSKARTQQIAQLYDIATRLQNAQMGWNGPICFQAIEVNNVFYVIEINARFGGGYPIAHRAGALFPKWLIQEALDMPTTANHSWKDGVTMLRYDIATYLND